MKKIKFNELELSKDVLKGIEKMGYVSPSPIQEKTIPLLLEGKDIIGQAQTGTGKTLAFGSVLLSKIKKRNKQVQGLILSPTRELALQIHEELKRIGSFTDLSIVSVYGGSEIEKQIKQIKKGADIVVGTPGRIQDLMRRKVLKLENIQYLVLDEADEMLNMGFIEDIENILEATPETKQTLLFSATMPSDIKKIASFYMQEDYQHVQVKAKSMTASTVSQYYFETSSQNKFEVLCRILDSRQMQNTIIFCRTKRSVDDIVALMQQRHYNVEAMHGDLSQNQRLQTLNRFKRGQIQYLVATDVAARGIDVEGITHVINYDLPVEKEAYVHRIGRTGRAGAKGKAISFVNQYEDRLLDMIQEYISFEIPVVGEFIEVNKEKREGAIKALKSKPKAKNEKAKVINKNITKLYFNGGKKKKLRAGDFVGAISKIEGITAEDIGIIDVQDTVSYVDILNGKGNKVIAGLKDSTIKGKKLRVEKAKR